MKEASFRQSDIRLDVGLANEPNGGHRGEDRKDRAGRATAISAIELATVRVGNRTRFDNGTVELNAINRDDNDPRREVSVAIDCKCLVLGTHARADQRQDNGKSDQIEYERDCSLSHVPFLVCGHMESNAPLGRLPQAECVIDPLLLHPESPVASSGECMALPVCIHGRRRLDLTIVGKPRRTSDRDSQSARHMRKAVKKLSRTRGSPLVLGV